MKKFFTCFLTLVIIFTSVLQGFAANIDKLFSETKYGWSLRLPTDFIKDIPDNREYEVNYFTTSSMNNMSVKMYSRSGLTLDSWVSRESKFIKDNYNQTYYTVIKTENGKIGTVKCIKVYLKILTDEGWVNQCNAYLVGKNYRYLISYAMAVSDYANSSKKALMEKYIASFKFTEPNPSIIGTLNERSVSTDSKTKIKLSSENFGWAFDLPDTWRININSGSSVLYDINYYALTVSLDVKDAGTNALETHAKAYEASLSTEEPGYEVTGKTSSKAKETDILAYDLTNNTKKARTYLIIANGNLYKFTFIMLKYMDTVKNSKVIEDTWNSFSVFAPTAQKITDYGALLGGITKGKAGDSYYNWSVTLPLNFKMTSRTFDGRSTLFTSGDNKSVIHVMVGNNEKKQNLDSILTNLVNTYKKEYTIITSEKRTKGTQEYAVLSYRGVKDNFVNEHRFFIVGNMILTVTLSQTGESYNKGEYNSFLDTFITSFPKDNSTSDLSNVAKDGLRLYTNMKFGWYIGILPEWYIESSDNKGNCADFYMDSTNSISVEMYSKELGLTLDKLIENEINRMNRIYNKQLTTISAPEDIMINGNKCKRVNLSFNVNGKMYYNSYIYSVGNNYRYKIGYAIDSKAFNDTSLKSGIEKMLTSFLIVEPSANTLGKLFDPDSENQVSSGRTVSSTEYKWSVTLPASFTDGVDNKKEDSVQYLNEVSQFDFSMDVYMAKKTLDEYVAESDKYMKDNSSYTVLSAESLNEKDTIVKKVIYKYSDKNDIYAYYYINYILCKNGYMYDIYFGVPDYRYTDYSTQVFKSIWDSMTF